MIYTIRFWKYGQWNYIPDNPVNSIEEAEKLIDKYYDLFDIVPDSDVSACQVMECISLSMTPQWSVYMY